VIRHRPRRTATAAVLAIAAAAAAVAATTVSVVPVAAAASAGTIVIDSVTSPADEPGLLSIQAEAPSKITALTVYIDSDTRPVLSIPFYDLSLTSGSALDGTWTVQTPITTSELSLGTYQVTVDATDAGGDYAYGISAPDPFFFGLYPSVTIAASTTTLSYSQQSVTFSGKVTADSPEGLLEGVPDQPVSITDSAGGSWPATTDKNGSYSVNIRPNLAGGAGGLTGSFSASVSGGPAIAQASAPEVKLTGDVDPVQVTVSLSKSVANFGTPVTFRGTAQYESGGVWLPLANSTVDISGKGYYSGRSVGAIATTTDSTGNFKVVLPAQPTTTWTANPPPSQFLTSSGSLVGLPNSATLTVVLPTRTTRLTVAYNPAGRITASGCLGLGSAVASFPHLSPPAYADIYLQYSRTSRGPWRTLGPLARRGAPKCQGGTGFTGTVGSRALSGHYRVDFTGQLLYQRSVSAAKYAVTAPTRIANFNITPRAVSGHGRIRLSGQLQQKARGWKRLGDVRVTIYVEPADGTTWYWFRHVKTSSSGKFRISFADPVSGHWAVGYAGNSRHLQSLSRTLYVSASGTTANLSQALAPTCCPGGRLARCWQPGSPGQPSAMPYYRRGSFWCRAEPSSLAR
jgi:hypothetical protein